MARRVVQTYVDAVTNGNGVILDDRTLDRPYGWVFFYQSRTHLETGAPSEVYVGNAPLIFNRDSGEYRVTGTAYPIEHYLKEYESRLSPSELARAPQRRPR